MKIITQISMFDDTQNENLGDLERLQKVFDKRESRYKLAPTASAYTNFLNNLKECEDELREMFDTLVKYMYKNLNGFGKIIAADGKAIQSYIRRISEKNSGNEERGMSTSVKKIHNN